MYLLICAHIFRVSKGAWGPTGAGAPEPKGPGAQGPYKRSTFLRMPREGKLHDVYLELLNKHDVYLEVLNKHDVYLEVLNKHDVYLEVLNKHACLFGTSK